MSKQEYEFVGKYAGFIQDGITAPFTYAIKHHDGYQPVTVLSEIGGFAWVKSSTFTTPFTCQTDDLCMVRKKPKEPREFYVFVSRDGRGLHADYNLKRMVDTGWPEDQIIKVREVVEE